MTNNTEIELIRMGFEESDEAQSLVNAEPKTEWSEGYYKYNDTPVTNEIRRQE